LRPDFSLFVDYGGILRTIKNIPVKECPRMFVKARINITFLSWVNKNIILKGIQNF
jgi:hypothetical protein